MTQKPTDQLLESLSAMADNEASELELRRILKSIDEEQTLDYWHRYQLIGATLRKETHLDCSKNLLNSINDAIDREDAGLSKDSIISKVAIGGAGASYQSETAQASTQLKWRPFLGQSMIAASIAAAFVVSFSYLSGQDTNQSSSMSQLASSTQLEHPVADNVPLGFDLPLPEARVVSGGTPSSQTNYPNKRVPLHRAADDLSDLATQQMLDQLLIEHAGRSSLNGSLGLMPFARVSKMVEGK